MSLRSRMWSLRRRLRRGSCLAEDAVVARFVSRLQPRDPYAVDIGAGDGTTMSNTFALFRGGWRGLAVEDDGGRFARLAARYADLRVDLARAKATPLNVVDLLRGYDVPAGFTFLSLDIDSYDYFVLEALLASFRPRLICAEVNEKIPPPLKFTVKWMPDHVWPGDHFFGQSIARLGELAAATKYALLELHYNNAFLAPRELALGDALTPEAAYERGYASREDRLKRFPWNREVDPALAMDAAQAEAFFRSHFAKYDGRFELSR